jgi:hypothetical protein
MGYCHTRVHYKPHVLNSHFWACAKGRQEITHVLTYTKRTSTATGDDSSNRMSQCEMHRAKLVHGCNISSTHSSISLFVTVKNVRVAVGADKATHDVRAMKVKEVRPVNSRNISNVHITGAVRQVNTQVVVIQRVFLLIRVEQCEALHRRCLLLKWQATFEGEIIFIVWIGDTLF